MCGIESAVDQMMGRQYGSGWASRGTGGSSAPAPAPIAAAAPAATAAAPGAGSAVSSLFGGGAPATSPNASPGIKSSSPISGKSVLQVS